MDFSEHYKVFSHIEDVKLKLTDAEYKNIMDTLNELRDTDKLKYNKAIITDMQNCVFSSIVKVNECLNLGALRPLEAVNFLACFANIITNISDMTNQTEDDKANKRAFIFNQLGTSHTGDYHKTTLQLLDYNHCKEMLELIDKLAI
jgi:hypothetical protein